LNFSHNGIKIKFYWRKRRFKIMTKTELVKAIAVKTGFTQKDVKEVLEATQEVVFATIKDEEVKLMDGVTLSAVYKEATTARNPMDGSVVNVPAKYAPKCRFGKPIKDAINA
jgi:DNA-binding protein HU-beta